MSAPKFQILVVEDNVADVFLIRTMLEEADLSFELNACGDGAEALRLIESIEAAQVPAPDLLLLDLNIPKHSGEEILQRFHHAANCAHTPVIVITSSDSPKERSRAAEMGASYFRKPADLEQFMALIDMIQHALANRNRLGV